jgi:hypothetical protein
MQYDWILRSLILQLIRKDAQLAAYVYECYVLKKRALTMQLLETLLKFLLSNVSHEPQKISYVWVVMDGINECELATQNKLLSLVSLMTLRAPSSSDVFCKTLVFCRGSSSASAKLRRSQTLSLSEEKEHLSEAIRCYAAQRLELMHDKFDQIGLTERDIEEIKEAIVQKGDGNAIRS